MVLKKLMASLGVGNAEVETILRNPNVTPGGTVEGDIHIKGGGVSQEIDRVTVSLMARVEVESGDEEYNTNIRFHRKDLSGEFKIQADQRLSTPFTLDIPWETPITVADGVPLRGMAIGVSTELAIENGVDSTDLDPITVHPIPPQERLLTAFRTLGFRFSRADLERGRLRDSQQQLPFYQEIEFHPPAQYAAGIKEIEVTFVTSAAQMEVVLEVDKRSGGFGGGRDSFERLVVDAANLDTINWEQELHTLLSRIGSRRGFSW